jgi:hypothetical protein
MNLPSFKPSSQTFKLTLALTLLTGTLLFSSLKAGAINYSPAHLIDDYVMLNTSSMDQGAIQAFLSGKNSSLANYVSFSGRDNANVSASQIIYEAARDYGINPQVILATLQKEQSLVTAQNPTSSQYNFAMGYGCPDSTGCSSKYTGFYNQVDNATWQFRADFELSSGRSYWGYSPSSYPCNGATRYYSAALKPGNNVTFFDDYGTAYSSFTISNASTATLYCYTPHAYPGSPQEYYSGSQNFENAFTQWGWSLYSNMCVSDPLPTLVHDFTFRKLTPKLDSGDVINYTGTGSNCVESHSWTPGSGFNTWQTHVISNLPMRSPVYGPVKFADLSGDGTDNPVYVGVDSTGSGMVEFHVWTDDMKQWIVHSSSSLPLTATGTSPSAQNSAVEFADLDGSGAEKPLAIQYKNTASGFVEFWIWSPGLQSWGSHIITNLAAPLDPSSMQIAFADLDGKGKDSAIAFGINGTSSGMVEFHVWAPGEQTWATHIASNLQTSLLGGCSIQFASLDGTGKDFGTVVCSQGTTSGKVEYHVWNPGLTSWQGHYASNLPTN